MDHPSAGGGNNSSGSSSRGGDGRPSPPKRPAGRTKFQETRHPVFRGVRRRGRAGRWVCEVRVPGSRGDRLWVGTFDTAEAAARAHDAAMIALCGASFAGLNFPDSASLLRVPRGVAAQELPDVQRAAVEAVAEFMRRHHHHHHHGGGGVPASSSAAPPQSVAAAGSQAASNMSHHQHHNSEAGMGVHNNGMQELDMYGGMDAGSYYASLAEGLLMEPPPPAVDCPGDEECGAGAGMELWS
ncbi:hypothetical protein PR202_gb02466 [Eleusine coracana subsp. coracana]|uniref:AP2/ERF domain-containing protein n=1 Tax=Eleusine coracana subsp. coracana TaxID=191504 RepID=A0AAV5DYT6_ELECO|nr:hypothetical protein QOZ80_8BG0668220 [Eleusine coracana subsp. coracana]GJN15545.1 hypothetical protein PR202_gb02466 [Eleusine coracana subsp. coracana]